MSVKYLTDWIILIFFLCCRNFKPLSTPYQSWNRALNIKQGLKLVDRGYIEVMLSPEAMTTLWPSTSLLILLYQELSVSNLPFFWSGLWPFALPGWPAFQENYELRQRLVDGCGFSIWMAEECCHPPSYHPMFSAGVYELY